MSTNWRAAVAALVTPDELAAHDAGLVPGANVEAYWLSVFSLLKEVVESPTGIHTSGPNRRILAEDFYVAKERARLLRDDAHYAEQERTFQEWKPWIETTTTAEEESANEIALKRLDADTQAGRCLCHLHAAEVKPEPLRAERSDSYPWERQ